MGLTLFRFCGRHSPVGAGSAEAPVVTLLAFFAEEIDRRLVCVCIRVI